MAIVLLIVLYLVVLSKVKLGYIGSQTQLHNDPPLRSDFNKI